MAVVRAFRLPDVGEGLTEAEVLRWFVAEGDVVEVNETLVEIETAKASVELPSPFAGVVVGIHVAEGQIVPVGTVIVSISVDGDHEEPGPASPIPEDAPTAAGEREAVLVGYGVSSGAARRRRRPAPGVASASAPRDRGSVLRPRAKPLVRKLARELGLDLSAITPTGANGDVTRADLVAAQAERPVTDLPAGEWIAVRGVRRAMAAAMTTSVATAPQAAVWVEVDVSAGLERLAALRESPGTDEVRLSPLLLAAAALVDAVREQPMLHGVWHDGADGPRIVLPDRVGLGVAADTARGLVVPVVHDPQTDDLVGLGRRIQEVVARARTGQARPADFLGGTVTLTNVGVFGVDGGLPILTPGQAVILAMGRVAPRPWVVDGAVVARPVVQLTMTFDHRILDGAQASAALAAIATALST